MRELGEKNCSVSSKPTLRERQAQLAREAVLEALVNRLERELPEEISLEELAREAGVSRRTLYRYFPNREALFTAAGEWIYRKLGISNEIVGGIESITESFADASRRLERHPQLVRAMLRSTVGHAVRSSQRHERVEAIRSAVAEASAGLPSDVSQQATAVIAYLCSSSAWVALQDEAGLPPEQSRQAIVWAIDTLVSELQRKSSQHGK